MMRRERYQLSMRLNKEEKIKIKVKYVNLCKYLKLNLVQNERETMIYSKLDFNV